MEKRRGWRRGECVAWETPVPAGGRERGKRKGNSLDFFFGNNGEGGVSERGREEKGQANPAADAVQQCLHLSASKDGMEELLESRLDGWLWRMNGFFFLFRCVCPQGMWEEGRRKKETNLRQVRVLDQEATGCVLQLKE